jgi:hypothetical protein
MQKLFRCVVLTACVATASAAVAGELRLSIANGRATLVATDVPAREILAEWARIGQTKIVNGDRIMGPNLTLQLVDRPEREVLDIVLRTVAGYVAAPRNAAVATLSVYDRILILPTSQAPAYNPAAMSSPTFQRPQMPVQMPVPMPEDDPVNHPNAPMPVQGNVQGAPGMPMPQGAVPQGQPIPGTPQQPPQTLPRPGMLPAPPPGMPNPYGPNPNPNQNPNVPVARPGGGIPPGTRPPGGGN